MQIKRHAVEKVLMPVLYAVARYCVKRLEFLHPVTKEFMTLESQMDVIKKEDC